MRTSAGDTESNLTASIVSSAVHAITVLFERVLSSFSQALSQIVAGQFASPPSPVPATTSASLLTPAASSSCSVSPPDASQAAPSINVPGSVSRADIYTAHIEMPRHCHKRRAFSSPSNSVLRT